MSKYLISYWGTSSEGYPEWKPLVRTKEDTIKWLKMYENCRDYDEIRIYKLDEGLSADDFLELQGGNTCTSHGKQ